MNYHVENQWGGASAPWHEGGAWVLGYRNRQPCEAIDIESKDNGKTFHGTMQYKGEGPILPSRANTKDNHLLLT